MTDSPKPGIYPDVPDADYRDWPYPSQSTLSLWRNRELCDADREYIMWSPFAATEEMQLGLDIEAVVDGLNPFAGVAVLPEEIKQRRGKAWETLKAAHPDVTFLPPAEYRDRGEYVDKVRSIATAVRTNRHAALLIDGAQRQLSFVWDARFTGAAGVEVVHRVKGRLDWLQPSVAAIPDLKTTGLGSPRAIGSYAYKRGWDIQSAVYTDAMTALTGKAWDFFFIVVRTYPPYLVTIFNGHNSDEADGLYLEMGRNAYQAALESLAKCRRTGEWAPWQNPNPKDGPYLGMFIPSWAE